VKLTINNLDELLGPMLSQFRAGIYVVDDEMNIADWSRGAEIITGHSASEVIGRQCCEVIAATVEDAGDVCRSKCPMKRALAEERTVECLEAGACFRHKNGSLIPARMSASPVLGDDGEAAGGIGLFMDITEQKMTEQELLLDSVTDDLTKLWNRRFFFRKLREECDRSTRYKRPLALLLLDVDNFKDYNDRYGHLAGDEVLIALAEMLCNRLRRTDLAFRLGGEEMVVLLTETAAAAAENLAEELRSRFEQIRFKPARKDGGCDEVSKTISIGVAQYAAELAPQEFVDMADRAMYQAKESGRNAVRVHP
jgi:diguanylate cyclase (GGDEF)-like protein/PAS domain S-box-containing protein